MKQYSFLQEAKFEPGTLSAQIRNHYNRMRPHTRMSPQMFDQIERKARKSAADEIRKFKNLAFKKREHHRQLQRFERLMKKFEDNHK